MLSASRRGDIEKVKSLLKTGISVDTKNPFNETPLLLAVESNHVETVKLLLEHKANVNIRCRFGTTPLASAVENKHIEIAGLLLEHDADVTFASKHNAMKWRNDDEFAIFVVENGYTQILKPLLNRGVSANLRSHYNLSLLHRAVARNYVEVVQLLLQYGANVNLVDSRGYIPLHYATICDITDACDR